MILISQNRRVAVELKALWVEDQPNKYYICHPAEEQGEFFRMGEYATEAEAIAQIEAIGKTYDASRTVYKFD